MNHIIMVCAGFDLLEMTMRLNNRAANTGQ